MAPVTLEQISEALSTTQQAVINTEECMNRALMVSTSTFFLGFSAGLFLQTKIRKYPKRLNFFLMPTVMGLAVSTSLYKRLSKKCEQQWRQGSNYTYSTDTTDRDGIGASG